MSRHDLDRRRFLGHALATAAAATTFSPLGRPRAWGAQKAPARGGPYVDVHTHIGRTWNGDPPLTPDALVKWMDENNVAKAVVLPLVSPESSSYLNLTEQALAAAKRFPDRLVPFCCIDPRTSYLRGRAGLTAMLKEYVDQGAKGFGEHKVGLPIDHPKMRDVYQVCDDLKLPVLFHCDNVRGTDAPGLPGLAKVLEKFPGVNFIGHGPGFWASISGDVNAEGLGGYPKTKVQPGGALDTLFDAHKNLWGDLSAGSGANALDRDHEFGRAFLTRRADRLLFGTDYLKPGQGVPQFTLLPSFDLPADVRAKIERENATKLLGLSA
jgi:predicted TIM-barrel fold metal-dependent hydrolase